MPKPPLGTGIVGMAASRAVLTTVRRALLAPLPRRIQPSRMTDAGLGVFASARAAPGDIVGFYPGCVYSPLDDFDTDELWPPPFIESNSYLLSARLASGAGQQPIDVLVDGCPFGLSAAIFAARAAASRSVRAFSMFICTSSKASSQENFPDSTSDLIW